MRCQSCRHELTEHEQSDPDCVRLNSRYCYQCIGQFTRRAHWPASEWDCQQYYDNGREPPGVVTQAARQ